MFMYFNQLRPGYNLVYDEKHYKKTPVKFLKNPQQ